VYLSVVPNCTYPTPVTVLFRHQGSRDFGSYADAGRRAALADVVAGAQQVLLTAAVDEDVPARLTGARFRVSASGVSRE